MESLHLRHLWKDLYCIIKDVQIRSFQVTDMELAYGSTFVILLVATRGRCEVQNFLASDGFAHYDWWPGLEHMPSCKCV